MVETLLGRVQVRGPPADSLFEACKASEADCSTAFGLIRLTLRSDVTLAKTAGRSISLPQDPATEKFWRTMNYLLGSSSREGKVAPGLFGPWIFSDAPMWEGDYTLDCAQRHRPLPFLLRSSATL